MTLNQNMQRPKSAIGLPEVDSDPDLPDVLRDLTDCGVRINTGYGGGDLLMQSFVANHRDAD